MWLMSARGVRVTDRRLRLGVAGLGRAFTLMLPTFLADRRVALVACADPREEARAKFAAEFGARAHADVAGLCADRDVDAVYVATPHQYHAEHAVIAAQAGKHLLIEKPMALGLDAARRMIDAARRASVHLVVGHSHSFDTPVRRARDLIESGACGRVRMIQALNYTDFLYRPRRPEELVSDQGGGVIFSQAAHQVDVARLLGGGLVKFVRCETGNWDASRPTEGAYTALLTFADGAFAGLTYNGYGRFDSDEFCEWIGEMGAPKDPHGHGVARRLLRQAATTEAEAALKAARNYGGTANVPMPARPAAHQHFGLVVVSCEYADLRLTPHGVMIYTDGPPRLDRAPPPEIPRREVVDELFDAVICGRPPLHSGEWGLATLEVCLAMLESARSRRDIAVTCQVGVKVGVQTGRAAGKTSATAESGGFSGGSDEAPGR
jgi:phthalate 4,5-cis-dihydrodiol dehydrogenase